MIGILKKSKAQVPSFSAPNYSAIKYLFMPILFINSWYHCRITILVIGKQDYLNIETGAGENGDCHAAFVAAMYNYWATAFKTIHFNTRRNLVKSN